MMLRHLQRERRVAGGADGSRVLAGLEPWLSHTRHCVFFFPIINHLVTDNLSLTSTT